MPKIVTTAAGAISDKSRLVIKRRSNPELKALHNHVVHNEYHLIIRKRSIDGIPRRPEREALEEETSDMSVSATCMKYFYMPKKLQPYR